MNKEKFQQRYNNLNPAQKQAVDTIEGPVLVVAGPGSGKTELLSIRVANILQTTDTLPQSILCLTFTDAAANNMRKRLSALIGSDAYKVAIHTFHSFSASIINQFPQYFYKGSSFNPADALLQAEILNQIFQDLPIDNPLKKLLHFQGYNLIETVKQRIQDLKSAGITPEQFQKILQANESFLKELSPIIQTTFQDKISKNNQSLYQNLLTEIKNIPSNHSAYNIKSHYIDALSQALDEAIVGDKFQTKPITKFKNDYTKKDKEGNYQLKDLQRQEKLLATAQVYKTYQEKLNQEGYFDFADLLLEVVKVLENNPEVRFDLQEKYLYLLVDEFQDTNGIQNRLLNYLLNLQVTEGRPNILAVGDDDQAIYKFQGAKIQNILDFNQTYTNPELVVLTNNYRSTQDILDLSRKIIIKSEERLENRIEQVHKKLISSNPTLQQGTITSTTFPDQLTELFFITEKIKHLTSQGHHYKDIAIITTKHRHLEAIAKILIHNSIPVSYERKKSILDKKPIQELITILTFINSLNTFQEPQYELLPEILSFHFLNFDKIQIWQLSSQAYQQRKNWLELMLQTPHFQDFATFLIHLAAEAKHLTAQQIIDYLTGTEHLKDINFHSNFKNHYFAPEKLKEDPNKYLDFLQALTTFVNKVGEHQNSQTLKITDLLNFVHLHQKYSIPLNYTSTVGNQQNSVHLLTAHGCKGLEFKTVFIAHADDNTWASTRRSSLISFPNNLQISSERDNLDDKLRLFYVALTRAKENLFITTSEQNNSGRELKKLRFLADLQLPEENTPAMPNRSDLTQLFFSTEMPPQHPENFQEVLQPLVQNYQLSVTHFNNFLNVIDGGPQKFLEQNLLRFPQAKSAPGSYGSAIHNALHLFHYQYAQTNQKPPEQKLLELYEQSLIKQRLNEKDHQQYLSKGNKVLSHLYQNYPFNPKDHSEYSFKTENVHINNAHLTGNIDRLHIDKEKKTIQIFDYKTGKPLHTWESSNPYEQIKAWKYKNQLIFYKLLVENSRTLSSYQVSQATLEFIEPQNEKLHHLNLRITREDLQETKELIKVIYHKIITLDFPDTSQYEPSLMGIELFKQDLLS